MTKETMLAIARELERWTGNNPSYDTAEKLAADMKRTADHYRRIAGKSE